MEAVAGSSCVFVSVVAHILQARKDCCWLEQDSSPFPVEFDSFYMLLPWSRRAIKSRLIKLDVERKLI